MGSDDFDKEMEDMMASSRAKIDSSKKSGKLGGKADKVTAKENSEIAKDREARRARDRAFYKKEKARLDKLTQAEIDKRK